ncbi:Triacylglycerol lipase [Bertholletia excelsa]
MQLPSFSLLHSSSSSSLKPLLVSFLFLLLGTAQAAIKLPRNATIPAVIMFGDSIIDTGNNNNLKTIFKVNYPPYGEDFMSGKPTGRFSNGKVPSDLFVEELGIKELLPAYLDPNLQPEDLPTGVNFASGGAGYDPLTSELASVISLSDQLDLFRDYITKLNAVVGEEKASTILASSVFVVVAGSNDITNTYFNNPLRRLYFDVPSYTDLMVSSASNFIRDLYGLGARRIGAFGIPPIGCVPSQRTLAGGPHRNCAENYNEAARLFNTKLSAQLSSLNSNLSRARMVYIDAYNLPLDLVRHPQRYGFKIANKGCCGSGVIEVAFLCSFTCANVSEYVFWDSFHLTERAYRIIVHQVLEKQIGSFI